MSIRVDPQRNEKVAVAYASGRLTKSDYDELCESLKSLTNNSEGETRLLLLTSDFEGWEFGGSWSDLQLDTDHFQHVSRLAIVADKSWHAQLTEFCVPFQFAESRCFDPIQHTDARTWLGLPNTGPALEREACALSDSQVTNDQVKKDMVHEASEESFPASDPPSWTTGTENTQADDTPFSQAARAPVHSLAEMVRRENKKPTTLD